MAKVIFKWRYTKPGSRQHNKNLVKYIAQRENVDKIDDTWRFQPVSKAQLDLVAQLLGDFPECADSHEYQDYQEKPSKGTASEFISRAIEDNYDSLSQRKNYLHYIAYRPGAERVGSHGLFTDANVPVDLNAVAEEVAAHDGIVMTEVLSIRREDAVRLGYDRGEVWRDMLRSQTLNMAKAMHIPLEDLRWYAAFHNESHHPHCHIVAYSVGRKPYMGERDLVKLKECFAHEIFRQDLMQTYQEQTVRRDVLKKSARERVQTIVQAMEDGGNENPKLEGMLWELAVQLTRAKGKKVYGYLPQTARNLVNNIVDELGKEEHLAQLYALWYEQRDAIVATYQSKPERRLPLSQNKTFQSIRNIVVQEALNLAQEALSVSQDVPLDSQEMPPVPLEMPQVSQELPLVLLEEPAPAIGPVQQPQPRQKPVAQAGLRLAASLVQLFQSQIQEQEQQLTSQVDRKLRRMMAEKKQAQGLKMG